MTVKGRKFRKWISDASPTIDGLELVRATWQPVSPGSLVVDVHAAALNFSDILMIEDKYQIRPERPFTPGQEIAGEVVSAPAGSGWQAGDRLAAKVNWGGFADRVEVRTDMAIRLPDSMGFAEAAALPVAYMTAMVALHHCTKIEPRQTVLVHAAAGGVGLAAVEIARAAGARVLATAGSTEKLGLAVGHGAHLGFNYRDDGWVRAVKEATGGRGADVILDPVGGEVARQSLRCIARDGVLLVVGFASGEIPDLPANRLLLKRAAAKGVYWNHDQDGPMLAEMAARLLTMMEKGLIRPVVDGRFGLEDLPHALAALKDRSSRGKIVLNVDGWGE